MAFGLLSVAMDPTAYLANPRAVGQIRCAVASLTIPGDRVKSVLAFRWCVNKYSMRYYRS